MSSRHIGQVYDSSLMKSTSVSDFTLFLCCRPGTSLWIIFVIISFLRFERDNLDNWTYSLIVSSGIDGRLLLERVFLGNFMGKEKGNL